MDKRQLEQMIAEQERMVDLAMNGGGVHHITQQTNYEEALTRAMHQF